MPLLMLDLDNTLVDRAAAFRAAAADFLAGQGLPAADLEWLLGVDAGGFAARPDVAAAVEARYGAGVRPELTALLDHGAADRVELAEPTRDALGKAAADGWTCVIVTNGRTRQQEAKIRRTGLDALVHGWVVSETVGHAKPDPAIFHAAATTAGLGLDGAWMVGDAPTADIAGAHGLGVRSAWVSAGKPWPTELPYQPTLIAPDAVTAIEHLRQA
ncbi:HAD family hydrolase [Yinghuangia seranimata]|uniref:HAD family hydrolase n=1 Tax=Yinghuangia seranimata TaxID=408067 RepID=UPI00248C04E1|nr:HAD family hydrolase [Yinghuangia seranimata]MDI2132930.1 HAD family hydrolase [Yinghuangia seranimata]